MVFVLHDVTELHNDMYRTRGLVLIVILFAMGLINLLLLWTINTLVLRRLKHMTQVATEVVGGNYELTIKQHAKDEQDHPILYYTSSWWVLILLRSAPFPLSRRCPSSLPQ